MFKFIFICITLILIITVGIIYAEPTGKTIQFAWTAVTHHLDGTPCDDLQGYALYQSQENSPEAWENLTGCQKAFILATFNQTSITITCPIGGHWFWVVRAYNQEGIFSEISNVIETEVDAQVPNPPLGVCIIE